MPEKTPHNGSRETAADPNLSTDGGALPHQLSSRALPPLDPSPLAPSGQKIDALFRLATDSKVSTRIVALEELERCVARAHHSTELRHELSTHLPRLIRSIQLSKDVGVIADLMKLGGGIAQVLEHAPNGEALHTSSESSPRRELLELAGAIVGKLYSPTSPPPPFVAQTAVAALARFVQTNAVTIDPLLGKIENLFPGNTRLLHGRELIAAAAAIAAPPPSIPRPGPLALFFGSRGPGGKFTWGEAESEAVVTLVDCANAPPPPIDALFSERMWAYERRVREAIVTLGRFAARNKGVLEPADSIRGSIALTACLSSPVFESNAIEALRAFGASAAPALPALLELAESRRHSQSTRGEALEAIGGILAQLPPSIFGGESTLGGDFLHRADDLLRGMSPVITLKTLAAVAPLGEHARPIAGAVEAALRNDLDETHTLAESEEPALHPTALTALEVLAHIDRSGYTAAAAIGRIFGSRRVPDELRHQLIGALAELTERGQISHHIADPMFERMVETPGLPRPLVADLHAAVRRCERALDLRAAQLPLTNTALLKSPALDTDSKHERLGALATNGRDHRRTVTTILVAAYREISKEPRLDGFALDLLRYLER